MRRQATGIAYDFSHIERVWKNACVLARHAESEERWEIDGDALEAACVLHDIGMGHELRAETPAEASARLAEEILRGEGLQELVWPVCETILAQAQANGGPPASTEARLLRDADALDSLGAVGVIRAILDGAARATPGLYDADDPMGRARPLDDKAWLLDHFPQVLFALGERMTTRFGRLEAERRTRVVRAFYEAVLREAGFDI